MEKTINSDELFEVLRITPPRQNIMLAGKHGIGKSQILTNYFEKKGIKVVSLFLGQMSDPGDIIGLPHFNEEIGLTEFMPPYWFPIDGKPIVLFLDELNRARPEILQTIMDLALNRCLAGKKLPEGSRIVSAINAGDEYQLTDLDPALISRFNLYSFKPSVDDWLSWALKNGIDSRITSYIRKNPERLDGVSVEVDSTFDKTPDRRAWQKVSEIISGTEKFTPLCIKIIAGVIGIDTATEFVTDQILREKDRITGLELLTKGRKIFPSFVNYKLPDYAELSKSIFEELEKYESYKMLRYEDIKDTINNFTDYIQWLSDAKKMEALAYLTTFYTDNVYTKANLFINHNCPKASELMVAFVQRMAG